MRDIRDIREMIVREVLTREFLNKYGVHIAVVFFVIALLAVVFRCSGGPSNQPYVDTFLGNRNLAFFVDEETGEESVHAVSEIPPLVGKSGKPTVVKALKFSTDGGKTAKAHYYLKYTEESKAELESLAATDPQAEARRMTLEREGLQVRSPAPESPWVRLHSSEGLAITTFPTSPDGKQATFVRPSKR